MCKEILFKKYTIMSKVNKILEDNNYEKIDKCTFKEKLKKLEMQSSYTIEVITDANILKSELVESNYIGKTLIYDETENYNSILFQKVYTPIIIPQYEFSRERVYIISGTAKAAKVIYDEDKKVKFKTDSYAKDISPIVFIKKKESYTKESYSFNLTQVIYVYIPEVYIN